MLSPNIGGLGLEFSKGGEYLDRLPFFKNFRFSSLSQKIEVVFHLRRPRLVWLWLRAWQRLLSLLFRRVGGWLEELELKQAVQFSFGLGLCNFCLWKGKQTWCMAMTLIFLWILILMINKPISNYD